MGKYFQVSFKDSSIEETYGWFGVYFNFEEPVICIAFFNFEGCGWSVYKRLFPLYINQKMPEGNLCSDPYLEEQDDSRSTVDAFFFDFLPPEDFENTTLEEQKEVLRKFFSEVMTKIALSEPLEDENTLTTAPADSSISGEEESMEN